MAAKWQINDDKYDDDDDNDNDDDDDDDNRLKLKYVKFSQESDASNTTGCKTIIINYTHHIRVVWWVNLLVIQKLPVNCREEWMTLDFLLLRSTIILKLIFTSVGYLRKMQTSGY